MLAVPVVPGGLSQSCPLLLGAAVGAHTSPSLQPPSIQGSGLRFHPKGFLASDSPHRGHRPTSAQSFPCFWLNFWPIIVPTAASRSPDASRVEEGWPLTDASGKCRKSIRPGKARVSPTGSSLHPLPPFVLLPLPDGGPSGKAFGTCILAPGWAWHEEDRVALALCRWLQVTGAMCLQKGPSSSTPATHPSPIPAASRFLSQPLAGPS